MKKGIILDLCGGTGSFSEPWKKEYAVYTITLPDFDVIRFEIIDSIVGKRIVFEHSNSHEQNIVIDIQNVVGILCAPPCTMFSRARTTASTPRDFDGAMRIVRACLEVVWACRMNGSLEFWCLENPMGLLRQFLGNPAASFRGYEYGDKHVKFTDLWGYFKMPRFTIRTPREFNRKKWAAAKKPAKYKHLKLSRADVRAITPPKFAEAFYKANRV